MALRTIKEFPNIEVIGHCHDGNIFAVPIEEADKVISFYDKQVHVQVQLQSLQKVLR
jgi:hypothetical protein